MNRLQSLLVCIAATVILSGCGEQPRLQGPPPPQIEKRPASDVRPGEQILIHGEHLGQKGTAAQSTGGALEVVSWTDSAVLVRVPEGTLPGPHEVFLNAGTTKLGPIPVNVLRALPVLTDTVPSRGKIGQLIEVTGEHLGKGPPEGRLFFYGTPVTQVESWTDSSIRFRIPKPGNHLAIWVEMGGSTSNELGFSLTRPHCDTVVPEAAMPGDTVAVLGKDFGQSKGRVLIGTPPLEAKIVAWSDQRVDCIVPAGLTGEVTVKVENDAGVSIPTTMHMLAPAPQGPIGKDPYEGKNAALALDAHGFPWVAYFDPVVTSLQVRHWTGASWVIETPPVDRPDLGPPGDAGVPAARPTTATTAAPDLSVAGVKIHGKTFVTSVGANPSMVFDDQGRLHVTCQDIFRQRLQYGVRTPDGSWKFQVVDEPGGAAGLFSSVKVDTHGNVFIASMEAEKGELRLARQTKAGFDVAKVDEGHVGITVSLALDPKGVAHMAYLDYNSFDLKYARADGRTFHVERADEPGWVGDAPSLAFDAQGRVIVAYGERDEGGDNPIALRFATRKADRWEIETVETQTGVGSNPCLVVDAHGRPIVACTDLRKKEIHLAVPTKTGWKIQRIPVPGMRSVMDAGEFRMVGDREGKLRIVYWDEKPSRLEYRVLDPPAAAAQ